MNPAMIVSLSVLAIASVLRYFDVIDDATYQKLLIATGGGGMVGLQQTMVSNNRQSATRAAVLAQMGGLNDPQIRVNITEPAKAPLPTVPVPPTAASNPEAVKP
jgi:hypothetical protein